MSRKKVYVETSIVSYLTARPPGDLLAAAWKKATIDWWETRKDQFDLYVSEVVIEEAGRGDDEAVARRLAALEGIPSLAITEEVVAFAEVLIQTGALPPRAVGDSLHVSLAAVHMIDYLLTWNYRHIDNAENKPLIRRTCLSSGYGYPEICTPHELMGVVGNG